MPNLNSFFLFCVLLLFRGGSCSSQLVLLKDAAEKEGAVCLDGTPGGYYFRPGSGSGASSWIVYLQGGGWCYDEAECAVRSTTVLGSSKNWKPNATFSGILSKDATVNSDFYNWNLAHLNYCDGASFAGNVTSPVSVAGYTLYFRGKRLLQAALDDISKKGLRSASQVLLTGGSAGGLATYLHCDYTRKYLPVSVPLKCLADAGYFLDAKNWLGQEHITPQYQYVFKMQNCSGGVNQDCISANKGTEWKCFFAQYTFPYIKTPMFQLNSLYDTWQIPNILQVTCDFPDGCPLEQKLAVLAYRQTFLNDSVAVNASLTSGMFLPACLEHGLSVGTETWTEIKVGGMTTAEAFAKWYFGSGPLHLIDCSYSCNPTCPKKG